MPSDCLAPNQQARHLDVSSSSQWVSFSANLAIILLDEGGRIVAANTRGRFMLLQQEVLRNEHGYLSTQGHYRTALRESVRQVLGTPPVECSGFNMCVSPVRLPVSVIVKPHKNGNAAAVVAVSDPNEKLIPDIRVLMMLYGVTATEGVVASALVSGLNVAETAKAHDMTVNTVRTHLKRLFEKTGARRQAELILIILSSSACFDPCQPAADWLFK
jgi:DNA-binding CsgD family transcriptional regulator